MGGSSWSPGQRCHQAGLGGFKALAAGWPPGSSPHSPGELRTPRPPPGPPCVSVPRSFSGAHWTVPSLVTVLLVSRHFAPGVDFGLGHGTVNSGHLTGCHAGRGRVAGLSPVLGKQQGQRESETPTREPLGPDSGPCPWAHFCLLCDLGKVAWPLCARLVWLLDLLWGSLRHPGRAHSQHSRVVNVVPCHFLKPPHPLVLREGVRVRSTVWP